MLSSEIDWLVTSEMRVRPQGDFVGWPAIKSAAESAHPEATIDSIDSPLNRRSVAVVRMENPDGSPVYVFVDPCTARVTGASSGFTVQRYFRDFHRRLFLSNVWGTVLVTAFSLVLLVSLVSALGFYKGWWKKRFRFRRENFAAIGKGRHRWSEVHKLAGPASLWFLFVIAITGAWYLFEEIRYDFGDGKYHYVGDLKYAVREVPPPDKPPAGSAPLPLDRLLDILRRERPDLELRSLWWSGDGVFTASGQSHHWLVRNHANQIRLDIYSGDILYNQRASDLPLYWRWSDTADPLHFGYFGGLTTKLIWFLFGLALSGLALTGLLIHIRRLTRAPGARWPGTFASAAVTVVILIASIPGALDRARDYGPISKEGIKHLPTLAPGVLTFIAAWFLLTLAIVAFCTLKLWRVRRPDE